MKNLLLPVLLVCFTVAAQPWAVEDPENPVCVVKTSLGDIYIEMFAKEAPQTVQNFIDLAEGTKEYVDEGGKKCKIDRHYYDGLIFHRVIKNFMIQGGCPQGTGSGGPGYNFKDEINASALGLDKLQAFEANKGQGQPHPYLLIRSQEDFHRILLLPLVQAMGGKYLDLLDQNKVKELPQKDLKALCHDLDTQLAQLTLKQAYENLGYHYDDALKSHHPKKAVIAMANSGPNTNGSQFFINLVDTPWLTGKHTVFGKVVAGMEVVDKIGEVPVAKATSKPLAEVKIISIRVCEK